MAKGGNNRDTEEHNEDGRSGRSTRDMGGNGHPKGGRREGGGRGERARVEGGSRRRERKLKVLNRFVLLICSLFLLNF